MANPTLKDIATILGVSTATVSRALRDSYEIGPATKKKVAELAKQLNYFPNPYASSLRKGRSKTIAVVLPEVADSFFSLAINGIESVAQHKGYHVLIYLTHESFEREEAILNEFKSGRVDGILISVSEETNTSTHLVKLMEAGMPVVFFDRICEDVMTAKVVTDDYESGYKATVYLLKKGCRNICFLSTSSNLSISKNRAEGYADALAAFRKKNLISNVVTCGESLAYNLKTITKLLKGKNKPDGFVVSAEKLIPPVYLSCKKLKISIPGNVKVIGFTNLQTSLILAPSLTTITQPAFEMGAHAAAILFKSLDKKRRQIMNEQIVIKSELVIRNSTGR
jgi:LacI family transcriptional regulator